MAVALLAVAGVASAVPNTSVSRADVSADGSLNLVPGPPVGGSELRDVAFLSAGESWAVGDVLKSTGANQTLIARFDGTRWSVVPSPNQSAMSNGLNSVSMTSGGGWAVGYGLEAGWTHQPLALHWNGSTWSNSPIRGAGLLRQVKEVTSDNVWAAGTYYDAGEHRTKTLVVHCGGRQG
jgi:hypothetical protein